MKRKLLFITLALPVMLFQSAQAQIASRLIGSAHWTSNGATFSPSDSATYSYSNARGGSMDLDPTHVDAVSNNMNMMSFDSSFTYTGDSLDKSTYTVQTFDANNNVTKMTTNVWDTATSTWVHSTSHLYTYNSSNMVTSDILQVWNDSVWVPSSQHAYSYNAAGMLFIDQYSTWYVDSTFHPASQKTYYYDGSMNQTFETDQAWVSGSPVYTNQWARTYSSTNQLLTTTHNTWSGTSWDPASRYTHVYDTVGNPLTLMFEPYNSTSHIFEHGTLNVYSNYTSAHLPQTVIHKTWNTGTSTWDNNSQYTYLYNTFNQVTNVIGESWNIVGMYEFANGDPMYHYYYQTYSPLSVKTVSSNDNVKIYPVPANNMMHVDLNWATAQSATISLIDVTGNVVRQWNTPTSTQYSSAVSVNGLATGMYIVKIAGEKDQVVKQIVVAH
jgi:hypothetical protein